MRPLEVVSNPAARHINRKSQLKSLIDFSGFLKADKISWISPPSVKEGERLLHCCIEETLGGRLVEVLEQA
ncbi:hypothetical protein AOLI_G00055070 [Acnodon oligacanthus]